MASSDSEKLLKFPSLFPIKVVGVAREGFTSEIHACVLDLVPDFDPESLENRLSSKGNYQSVTVRVIAQSQEHLDQIYLALNKIDGVKFKRKVVPGDTLQFEIHLMEPIRRGVAVVEAKAFVGETLACEAVLMAQVVKNKNNK